MIRTSPLPSRPCPKGRGTTGDYSMSHGDELEPRGVLKEFLARGVQLVPWNPLAYTRASSADFCWLILQLYK